MRLNLNYENHLVIPSRHGPVEYGMIGLIQKIIHLKLQGEVQSFQVEGTPGRDIIHEIGIEPVTPAYIISGSGIPFTGV